MACEHAADVQVGPARVDNPVTYRLSSRIMDPAPPNNDRPDLTFITQALPDEARWLAAFDRREIPVLADTAAEIEELRANEDAVDAHLLSETLQIDPLMTLKLLRHVALHRRGRQLHDAETTTEALVMLGIAPISSAISGRSPRWSCAWPRSPRRWPAPRGAAACRPRRPLCAGLRDPPAGP